MFSPRDALAVRYQNYMLARTMRPLKDEDFQNMAWIVWGMKAAGFGCLVLSGLMMVGVSILR
ncbi:MAG: hypothetical protein ACQKBV_00920 [Puniceicoccales bacterium]